MMRSQLMDKQLSQAGWSRNKRNMVEEYVVKVAELLAGCA